MPRGDQPERRGIGGIVDVYRDASVKIGPRVHVRPRIGIDGHHAAVVLAVERGGAAEMCGVQKRFPHGQPGRRALDERRTELGDQRHRTQGADDERNDGSDASGGNQKNPATGRADGQATNPPRRRRSQALSVRGHSIQSRPDTARGQRLVGGGRVGRMSEVLIRRLDPDVPLPAYARSGDAGADLVSTADVLIAPGERTLVPTGIAMALPEGMAGFIHPRSGLALRHGLSIVNTPGTIDAGYRGEIKVLLVNHDHSAAVRIERGDRIAQLVVQRVEHVTFTEASELDDTERGSGGYGSTGVAGTSSTSVTTTAGSES